MSDASAPPRPTLSPFSFALAGTFLLLVSAGYSFLAANPFYPEINPLFFEWSGVNDTLLPFAISGLGCIAWWFGRSKTGLVLLGSLAILGVPGMLLQDGWGATLLHGSPQSTMRHARVTYASDLLFFLGFLFDALACATMDWTAVRRRRARAGRPPASGA